MVGNFTSKECMPKLKVLYLEDSSEDAELLKHRLGPDFDLQIVSGRIGWETELKKPQDVILADYKLDAFDVFEAIEIKNKLQPSTPIILVSGSVNDETASMACQKGFADFVLKDRLARLKQAIERAHEFHKLKYEQNRDQRLESVGSLATGMAHDLNNVLGSILMGSAILRDHVSVSDKRILDQMQASAQRGAEMIKQILLFARGSNGVNFKPVTAEYLIGQVISIIRDTFPRNIRILNKVWPGTSSVQCNDTQIHQILLNLCVNARDAMPSGGTLVVEAQNVYLDDEERDKNGELFKGEWVRFMVKDNGVGMPQEILLRIFEPYYTTKSLGLGTGLGLSQVSSLVSEHHGHIQVQSKEGSGSTFYVYLPTATREGQMTNKIEKEPILGNGELILLVDDEVALREIIEINLVDSGYYVLVAENGEKALPIFRNRAEDIAILITDMMMPIMDGPTLAAKVKVLNPKVKLVYISGIGAPNDVYPKPDATLNKPFSVPDLLNTLAKVLGK